MAKMAATLDVISGGRLIFGIGAGWIEKEHITNGIPFPEPSVRIEQLRESLQIIKKIWTEDKASYQGEHYAIRDVISNPKPVRKPHPPILIGGTGRRLLRVIAELGDYCNYDRLTPEESRRVFDVIEGHCSSIGRNPREIGQSFCGELILAEDPKQVKLKLAKAYESFMVMAEHARGERIGLYQDRFRPTSIEEYSKRRIVGTPQQCIDRIGKYVDLGVDHFIFVFPDIKERGCLELFMDRVAPSFRRR
jgi:alkanesulfonate monooxygenase SsuD/methylene tetrahydromethanopterin reductase-like flavin-dependent oxidoreductase (luciferase family)